MVQTFPRPVNPKVKKQTDDQIAKVGQLNQLVRDVNQLATNPSSPVTYPFEWYPDAGLTNNGAKFTYTDGVELISYHIKGIYPVQIAQDQGSFNHYLCTVNFPEGEPFLFPGSVTGMFQAVDTNNFGSYILSPLANGAILSGSGEYIGLYQLSDFRIYLTSYENNPQEDGSYNYALIVEGAANASAAALMSYDFEFLLPNGVTPPTIFQD
jgi:hypothetical protein